MTDGPEKLLTFTDVAKRLGVSHTTVSRWVDAGLIGHFKMPLGGSKRIPESEFHRFWRDQFIKNAATSAHAEHAEH